MSICIAYPPPCPAEPVYGPEHAGGYRRKTSSICPSTKKSSTGDEPDKIDNEISARKRVRCAWLRGFKKIPIFDIPQISPLAIREPRLFDKPPDLPFKPRLFPVPRIIKRIDGLPALFLGGVNRVVKLS